MRKMSREHDVAGLAGDRIDNPACRVGGLKPARCGEGREWVATAPVGFRRLPCAQFSAVPDDFRLHAARGSLLRERFHFDAAAIRERPHGIHLRPDRIAVVNEIQHGSQSSSLKGPISASVGCVSSRRPIFTPCSVASNRSTSRIARSN